MSAYSIADSAVKGFVACRTADPAGSGLHASCTLPEGATLMRCCRSGRRFAIFVFY